MERNGKRKSYSREFKLEAVRLSNDPTKTIAEVARELGIRENDLHAWRYEVAKKGDNVFPGAGSRAHKVPKNIDNNELARLRKENAQLRQERDILKKSLIFFAKDQDKDLSL